MATQLKSKPKANLKAAAARKVSAKKKATVATKKPAVSVKKPTAKTTTTPARTAASPAAVTAPAGVYSNSTGSLVSPQTWKADQARLQSAWDDAEAATDLDAADANDTLEFLNRKNEIARDAEKARLKLDQDRFNMRKQAAAEKNELDTNLSYRGASRGSAGIRQRSKFASELNKVENEFNAADSSITTEKTAAEGTLSSTLNTKKASRAAKRRLLAERASQKGVYSSGSTAASNTGVTAPGLVKPATNTTVAKPAVVKPVPAKAPVKKPTTKKPVAKKAVIKKAAQRKVASKKGKK